MSPESGEGLREDKLLSVAYLVVVYHAEGVLVARDQVVAVLAQVCGGERTVVKGLRGPGCSQVVSPNLLSPLGTSPHPLSPLSSPGALTPPPVPEVGPKSITPPPPAPLKDHQLHDIPPPSLEIPPEHHLPTPCPPKSINPPPPAYRSPESSLPKLTLPQASPHSSHPEPQPPAPAPALNLPPESQPPPLNSVPRRTVVGDDLVPAVQAGGPVAEQHEVPAAALRAPDEIQKERAALQAGSALRRQHRAGTGAGNVKRARPGPPTGPVQAYPLRVLGADAAPAHRAAVLQISRDFRVWAWLSGGWAWFEGAANPALWAGLAGDERLYGRGLRGRGQS